MNVDRTIVACAILWITLVLASYMSAIVICYGFGQRLEETGRRRREPEQHARVRICVGQSFLFFGAIAFGGGLAIVPFPVSLLEAMGLVAARAFIVLVVIAILWFGMEWLMIAKAVGVEPNPPKHRYPRLAFVAVLTVALSVGGFTATNLLSDVMSGTLTGSQWNPLWNLVGLAASAVTSTLLKALYSWVYKGVEVFPLPKWR